MMGRWEIPRGSAGPCSVASQYESESNLVRPAAGSGETRCSLARGAKRFGRDGRADAAAGYYPARGTPGLGSQDGLVKVVVKGVAGLAS